MGKICIFFLSSLLLFSLGVDAQSPDSLIHAKKKFRWIAPAALIVTGTALMLDTDADEFFLSNYEIREERNESFLNFSNHADDYLQYAPAAAALIMSVSGVKGKHTLPNQLALLIKSELLMTGIVYSLKYTVGEARPDTGQKNSFPSGHTAQAFTAATFLSKEYGHKSIWISIGAYTAASTVGVFRMLNNRHWVSGCFCGCRHWNYFNGAGLLHAQKSMGQKESVCKSFLSSGESGTYYPVFFLTRLAPKPVTRTV